VPGQSDAPPPVPMPTSLSEFAATSGVGGGAGNRTFVPLSQTVDEDFAMQYTQGWVHQGGGGAMVVATEFAAHP
jgi:hypothetical protein